MAKTVWKAPKDIEAHHIGFDAAASGRPRKPDSSFMSYDEKAAFNDGWDCYNKGRDCQARKAKVLIEANTNR